MFLDIQDKPQHTTHTHCKTVSVSESSCQSPSWQRILADSYKKPRDLLRDLDLPYQDVSADALFATRVPRPFVAKMEQSNLHDPLLLQVLPTKEEFDIKVGFTDDPLKEKQYNPLPGLLHKYQSRVLLTLQGACAINCRYCFRRHFEYSDNRVNKSQLANIIEYISAHSEINEVVLSGGDPLMNKDSHIADLVTQLSALPQLKRLRFHTRLPVVIPERITEELANIVANTHLRVIMVIHSNHPNEIDEHFYRHIKRLTDVGVQIFNQSVLLKGVNDNADILAQLSEKLFDYRIMPYYLFMLDKVNGAGHFEVSEKEAQQLIRDVAAKLPGYLVPKLTRETAGLPSKNMWV